MKVSPKKKNNKNTLEGIMNKLSSVAKAQQKEGGKGETPTKVTKPVKLSSKKTMSVKSEKPVKSKMLWVACVKIRGVALPCFYLFLSSVSQFFD